MGQVKHYLLVCYFVSFLVCVFKSAKATAPVLLTKWDGTVFSPNYPFTYPANTTLTWIKTVSSGSRITITINDFQTQCEGDYLEIRDGDSLASPVLAKFCGRSGARQSVSSSGTHMLLHFVSDNVTDSFSSRGFDLTHSGVCKLQTNATSGVITTPQYPGLYLNYMDCLWTIKLHPSMLIALECHDIALEYKEDCTYDYMEILAGVSLDDAHVLGRFCGIHNHSLTFERDGNMSIRFVSDSDKELSGFRCAYNVDKVKGDWTEWTTWTECSQTCHHGNQTRYRTCLNPLPESGLELVCGHVADNETRSCLISNCIPVDGGYSSWSNWSACNVSCGTGFRNRSRSCTNPPPAFTGKNCSEIGVPWETTECVLTHCPGSASVMSISSPTSHFATSTYVMLHSFLTVTSSHNSSVQQLATTSSSYSSVAISPSNSGAVPFLGDSHATPYSKFSLFTSLTRPSSTPSSARNILSASSTKNLQNRMTSDVQGVHVKTSHSTLDELHTSNKTILNDRPIISANFSSSNIYSTDEIWKTAPSYYSYSSKPRRLSTEPLTLKSKLFGDSISTVGQPGQQNVEISSGSFLSRTKFKSFNSQTNSTASISKISSSYPSNSSITWHVFSEPLTSNSDLLKDSISTVALTRYHTIRVSSTSIHTTFLHSKTILKTTNSQLDTTYYASSRHLSNSYTPSKEFAKKTGQPIAGISTVLTRTFSASYTSTYLSNSSTSWQVLPAPFTPYSKLLRDSSPTTVQKRQSVVDISSFGLNAVSLVLRTVTETYSSKKDSNTIRTRISSSFLSLYSKPLLNKTSEDSQAMHISSTHSTLDVSDASSSSTSHDRAIFSANVSNTKEDSTVENSKIFSVYQSYSSTPTQLSMKPSTLNSNLVRDSSSQVRQTGQPILSISHTVPFLSSTILENCSSQADQGHHVTSMQTSLRASESQKSQQSHITWRNHSNGITLHTLPATASFEPHPNNLESSIRTEILATKMDHGHTESGSTANVSGATATLPTSTNWKLYYNRTQESSIMRSHTRRTMAQSTWRTHSVSGYYHHNNSQSRSFSTAESTMQSTWRPNIDGESLYLTTTSYVKLTSFLSSVMLLPSTHNGAEASSIRRIQTQNSMLTLATLGQFCQQAGSSSPPMVPPTQTSPLLFTRETIISPAQNQSKISTWRSSIHISETILSNFNVIHNSSLNTPQNGVTLSSDVIRSSNHIFKLATKREILHSTEQSSEDVTRSSDHIFSLSTISKISHSNVAFPSSDSQNTEMVYSSRTSATSSISGSQVGVASSRSESYQVNPVLSWGRKTAETKKDPGHTETVTISHATATCTTTVCCEASSVYWPRAMESSMNQANRESTHATKMLQMVTAQVTSHFKVSFDRTAGSEMDDTEINTSSSTQSPISASQVSTTLSRLSVTICPSRTAPSSPAVDSTTSTLTFPWHLLPFVVISLVIFVALVTYCLRVPDITEKIFLAFKERKKQITRSRQEKSFDVMKGDVFKHFEASTFHSYQRELFYDATLNYAMFEKSTTRAIEFSIHLDEEDQSAGPEEAVEISCVLGDEPANGKQASGSLSEMFDTQ